MKSNPAIFQQVKTAIKNDNIIGSICSNMVITAKSKNLKRLAELQVLYKERKLEIIKKFMQHYNKTDIVLFLDDFEL